MFWIGGIIISIEKLLLNKNYKDLHLFFLYFIERIGLKSQDFLVKNGLERHLISKEFNHGEVSKIKLLMGNEQITLVSYALFYTFFEIIEYERTGERPNDVSIGFVIRVKDVDSVVITRNITSEYSNFDYPHFEFHELTNGLIHEILKMEDMFLSVLEKFFFTKELEKKYFEKFGKKIYIDWPDTFEEYERDLKEALENNKPIRES